MDPIGFGMRSEWANKSWVNVWTGFVSDNEIDLLRNFEFLLWPILPGQAYPSLIFRAQSPPQFLTLALGMLLILLLFDFVTIVRSRRTAILRPSTYFCIAWFILLTMPLSLIVRDPDKPYLAMHPAMAVCWFFGLTLRRVQKSALPGQIRAAHLEFSDIATTVSVKPVPLNGSPVEVSFEPKTVTWVRLVVDAAGDGAVGLTEFRVFGQKAEKR
jgi:hypothetical protein